MSASVQAVLLGIVQGLTEFLPVSSTAHLILARAFFGFDGDKFGLSFDVACHIGTLLAVVVYFRAEITRMIRALPLALRIADRGLRNDDARMIWLLVVGTVPAVVAGLLFKRQIEEHLRTALALVPGVSRSGATIVAALVIGLRRADAARFIFLLSIPAILGAAASEAPKMLKAGLGGDLAMLFAIGIVSSAIVGYAAVRFFIRYLGNHSLDVFAGYRLALAAVAGVWLLR